MDGVGGGGGGAAEGGGGGGGRGGGEGGGWGGGGRGPSPETGARPADVALGAKHRLLGLSWAHGETHLLVSCSSSAPRHLDGADD